MLKLLSSRSSSMLQRREERQMFLRERETPRRASCQWEPDGACLSPVSSVYIFLLFSKAPGFGLLASVLGSFLPRTGNMLSSHLPFLLLSPEPKHSGLEGFYCGSLPVSGISQPSPFLINSLAHLSLEDEWAACGFMLTKWMKMFVTFIMPTWFPKVLPEVLTVPHSPKASLTWALGNHTAVWANALLSFLIWR